MRFGLSVFGIAFFATWFAAPANAAGSMALCLQAGFSQSCCKAEEAKGGFYGDNSEAAARRWNSLAMCKTKEGSKAK